MGRIKGEGRITTSVTISPKFYELAKKYNISFSEALRVGMSIMLADRGEIEYDNNLNLHRKMNLFRVQAEQALQKIAELEAKEDEHKDNKASTI